jgi:hypothetical protein
MFIWESSNLLLLVPVAVGLVILVVLASQKGGIHGGQDWLLRFGQSREKVFTLRRVSLQTLAHSSTA